ncbi:hypothetical protein [Streptomyces mirabilis]|uniref:hypothetical protein n=1 Tax=Streptomyces mirabilis TaxID=68239 RepID=UPI00368D23DA
MATRKGLPPEWRDLPPEFKHPSEFKLPLKVKLQVAGRFLVVVLGACAVLGAAAVAVVLFFHGGDDRPDQVPAPARESASAPKSAAPSTPSLHDPVVKSRFESALESYATSR